jgi:hypothetical protein
MSKLYFVSTGIYCDDVMNRIIYTFTKKKNNNNNIYNIKIKCFKSKEIQLLIRIIVN